MSTTIPTVENGTDTDSALNRRDFDEDDLPVRALYRADGETLQVVTISHPELLLGPAEERHLVASDRGTVEALWVSGAPHVFDEAWLELGVDAEGATHIWNVWDNVVYVVNAAGALEYVFDFDDEPRLDVVLYLDHVENRRGWTSLHPVFAEVRA
ncbi:hypothetical protein ACFQJC_04890 [Haloferax namakaokahaiae]|uniref:S9 family peptidase n=1 Tax=Haloferax namakaokahaiae TaxID=1748331 RepID=A0ABD5ZCF6_9EURY